MEKQEGIVIKEFLDSINDFLLYAFKKSGLRMNNDILNRIILRHGEEKLKSVFMASYNPEDDTITLYIDAITDYASYIGRPVYDVIAKIFFTQIHHHLTRKKNIDYLKAEKFATKVCRKLLKQGIIEQMPPIFYIDAEDKNMYYQRLLRKQWFERWIDMDINDFIKNSETIMK